MRLQDALEQQEKQETQQLELQQQAEDLRSLTVAELKHRLQAAGLSESGRKSELVKRLQEAATHDDTDSSAVPSTVGDSPPLGILGGSQLGEKLLASVLGKDKHGVLVDVGKGRQGFVSSSLLHGSWVEGLADSVQKGQEVDSWIISAPSTGGRVRVAMALKRPTTDLSGFEKVDSAQWLPGVVTCIMNFGVFVEVTPPRRGPAQWGLVRKAFWSGPERIGREVQVRVVSIDGFSGRLGLSTLDASAEEPRRLAGREPQVVVLNTYT